MSRSAQESRPNPGLALAVVTLAAAGLTGGVVAGAAWAYDRWRAPAAVSTGATDAAAAPSQPGTAPEPTTPGWAESLGLPVEQPPAAPAAPAAGPVDTGDTTAAGRTTNSRVERGRPSPAPAVGGWSGSVAGSPGGSGGPGGDPTVDPVPTDTDPTSEAPADPAPTEPAPTDPEPTDPAATEPVVVQRLQAMRQQQHNEQQSLFHGWR